MSARDRVHVVGGRHIAAALALAILVALIGTVGAAAQGYEEPTRKQWVRQADRICERPYKRGNKLVERFGRQAKRERWVPAGKLLIRVGKIVVNVAERVGELERPPADEDAIETYVDAEERAGKLTKKAGRVLKRKKVRHADELLNRAARVSDRGQKSVKRFGLRECI